MSRRDCWRHTVAGVPQDMSDGANSPPINRVRRQRPHGALDLGAGCEDLELQTVGIAECHQQ